MTTRTPRPAAAVRRSGGFPPELQVKQYVAQVNGRFGFRFRVFETGSSRHYLFVCVQNSDIQFPVAKADLRREVRSALAHGWGHTPRNERGK